MRHGIILVQELEMSKRSLFVIGLGVLATGFFAAGTAMAATDATSPQPTFYRDVQPILQAHCQECHRPAGTNYGGLLAPMSLISYDEVRPWSKSIARQVVTREMPPWDADQRHRGVFLNERSLTDDQIEILTRWVAQGAVAGEADDAQPARIFENQDGWMIGTPNLIVPMPEPFRVGDDVRDLYTAFYVDLDEEQLPGDRWITAFQCKPGTNIIHHFNVHLLAPDADGGFPEPPSFPTEGQLAPPRAGTYIGGTASGTDALPYPEGFGLLLKKGTRVTFDIHYHKEPGEGTAVTDLSHIGFTLSEEPPTRQIGGGTDGRGPLATYRIAIPPEASHHQLGPVSRTWTQDSELINLMPHMHMRGAAATFEAFYPDGTSEVLLHVPRYDFGWQTVYRFRELKRIPAGTRIDFTAWYDNTADKAALFGFDSTRTVTFGPESTDEMMMGFITSAVVEPAAPSGGR